MALTDEQIERIESKANGTLSDIDAAQLEQELSQSPGLREEAEEHLEIYWALKSMALLPRLKRIHAEIQEEELAEAGQDPAEEIPLPKITPRQAPVKAKKGRIISLTGINWGWLSAASVVLIVFSVGIVNFRHKQNDRLYGQYKSSLADSYVIANQQPPDFIKKGNVKSYYDKFRQGVEFLDNGQPEKAIEALEIASQTQNRRIRQEAEWFLSLAYLKNNDRKNAEKMVSKIVREPDNKYYVQAKRMQADL